VLKVGFLGRPGQSLNPACPASRGSLWPMNGSGSGADRLPGLKIKLLACAQQIGFGKVEEAAWVRSKDSCDFDTGPRPT
jgi:hypothetical protein